MDYSLQKNERLHSKKSIKELFVKGSSFFLYPFKVSYMTLNGSALETNQVLFSVSKRKIKKAVDRNYVKRRLKEAYRLNKFLLSSSDVSFIIALVYVASEKQDFHAIQMRVQKVLKRITDQPSNLQKNDEKKK